MPKSKIKFFRKSLFAAALLFVILHANAQRTPQELNSLRNGSWKLYTDYKTKSTTIRFFDSKENLLYEEVIRGKYIKLNKKNVRQLDETLAKLTARNLVSSSVNSMELLTEHLNRPEQTSSSFRSKASSYVSNLKINAFPLIYTKKIMVVFENPDRERISIILKDIYKNVAYEQTFVGDHLKGVKLDVVGMKSGIYFLTVKGKTKTIVKEVHLQNTEEGMEIKFLDDTVKNYAGMKD